ncbi:hypothetical protein [Streptomyces badius]|uniref:Peptidase inhibitor family I36 n=1 Tax=Streptomyces badius TaxID=1941 RepID=A0ABQ2T6B6_STRBA|nr:hypothetical protein [Streptomyces badius]GGS51968.1 hypothetical protein GCM10010253_27770 [Streptomyces badius]
MSSKRPALSRAATVAAVSVALLATGTSTAMADGDGDCTDTGNICVFNQQQPTSYHNGYYDLNDPHPNFHGKYYLIKRAYLGDSIGAASNDANSPTSCAGFTFYWNTGYGGTSYFASRNFNYLTFYDNNDEFSSFRKTGC